MNTQIYNIEIDRIDGSVTTLAEHEGKVLLIVNVASKCGYTSQYEGLVKLQQAYGDRGFAVLGFPSNDFWGQEPGTNEEIREFCATNFGVQFPMYSKIAVAGPTPHPLYAYLCSAMANAQGREAMEEEFRNDNIQPAPPPEVIWNFENFLVARDGQVVGRFVSTIEPDAAELVAAVEAALA